MRSSQTKWTALFTTMVVGAAMALAQDAGRDRQRKPDQPQPAQRGERREARGQRVQKEDLHKKRPPKETRLTVFNIAHGDVEAIANAVMRTVTPTSDDEKLRIVADEHTSALLVATSSEDTLDRVKQLVAALDQSPRVAAPLDVKYVVVWLEHADACDVVNHVHQLLRGSHRGRGPGPILAADERTNAVWIASHPSHIDRIREMVEHMDAEVPEPDETDEGHRELRFHKLKNAIAPMVAATLRDVLEMMESDACVVGDAPSGVLITYATADEANMLRGVVEQLDVPAKKMPRPKRTPAPPAKEKKRKDV